MTTTVLVFGAGTLLLLLQCCLGAWPEVVVPGATAPPPQLEAPNDPLGRTTPHGTVLGFLTASQKKKYAIAAEYLNTDLRGKAAEHLAEQLSVVLDRRLPARLNQLSDKPEGSLRDPLNPDRDLVGTIASSKGDVEIMVEREVRGKSGPVWLFSSKTLESIPNLYKEIDVTAADEVLPGFLVTTRVLGIQLFEWAALFLGLPLLYLVTVLLNRVLSGLIGRLRRHWKSNPDLINPEILHKPTRLLLIALTINWIRPRVGLSLLARQFWSSMATVTAVAAIVWILILLTGRGEEYVNQLLRIRNLTGTASVLRLARRVIDLLFVFGGVLGVLYYFGFSPTAALAGLGVGGIAVALAAQKTLENVIGGVSLIADQVVRVGDTLKVGDIVGQVEEVGLRSARIRTADRTVVSIPNGQIAGMSLETLSLRDKFWFHPPLSLHYESTVAQIQAVVNDVRVLLVAQSCTERNSVRVRLLGFDSSSFDVDIFAYIYARDWNHFLEIQEGFLISILEIIQQAGTHIALPSRNVYVSTQSASEMAQVRSLAEALPTDRRSNHEKLSRSLYNTHAASCEGESAHRPFP
ncbi:MAG TPA: mechanosensitive ion channel domain-containing protein [Terriglobales bacterium]|nr:mechanosensitive ion channel domain-containing protein [Terriglobales bacterium]